jgi:anti-sigma factor RsiW
MNRIGSADERLLHCFLDRELPPHELRAFEQRLEREPELARALEELRSLRRLFRTPAPEVPVGLTDRVLAAVRSAPFAAGPFPSGVGRELQDVARCSRRILLAAALLVAGALALLASSWSGRDPARLEASPDELQSLIERVRSRPPEPWAVPGAAERR